MNQVLSKDFFFWLRQELKESQCPSVCLAQVCLELSISLMVSYVGLSCRSLFVGQTEPKILCLVFYIKGSLFSAGWPMFSHSMGCRPTSSARWPCSVSPCSATWSAPPTWGLTSSSSEPGSWQVTSAWLFNIYGHQIVAIYSLGQIKCVLSDQRMNDFVF